jgi:hypothetical protein
VARRYPIHSSREPSLFIMVATYTQRHSLKAAGSSFVNLIVNGATAFSSKFREQCVSSSLLLSPLPIHVPDRATVSRKYSNC